MAVHRRPEGRTGPKRRGELPKRREIPAQAFRTGNQRKNRFAGSSHLAIRNIARLQARPNGGSVSTNANGSKASDEADPVAGASRQGRQFVVDDIAIIELDTRGIALEVSAARWIAGTTAIARIFEKQHGAVIRAHPAARQRAIRGAARRAEGETVIGGGVDRRRRARRHGGCGERRKEKGNEDRDDLHGAAIASRLGAVERLGGGRRRGRPWAAATGTTYCAECWTRR